MEEYVKINILYEDNHILVVEKPVNMPVCSDESKDANLLDELKKYIKVKYNKPGNVYLGLVHRLDRPVGGVMVFARTSKAASRLSRDVQEHKIEKRYYAVVDGIINESGSYTDYLEKNTKTNISRVTTKDRGKIAKLTYKRIAYKNSMSLVEVFLETGRSHQIRVQFSYHGYPLVGDNKYNKETIKIPVCLFSHYLSFEHPTTKEKMEFDLGIPNRQYFNIFKKN